MPNWQPNWANVRWDWGAAEEAARSLRRMADLLDSTAAERRSTARDAQSDWRGRHRETFDEQLAAILRRSDGLASDCRAAAERIGHASQRAAEEQHRRDEERARWRRECEEEERRRREEESRRRHR